MNDSQKFVEEKGGIRHMLLMAALGVAGLALTILLSDRVNPLASVDACYGREEILQKGAAYLSGLGYDLTGLQLDGWSSFSTDTHIYLQTRVGMQRANEILRADSLPAHHWFLWWYDRSASKSQNRQQFYAWISLGGRILGFQHIIGDSVMLPSIDSTAADTLARQFLARQGIPIANYAMRNASNIRLQNRTDHQFLWAREVDGAETTVSVRIQGNAVGSFRMEFSMTGPLQRGFAEAATSATLFSTGSIAVTFLLSLFITVLFLKKYHEGEVGSRSGMMVFLGFYVLSVLSTLNLYSAVGSGTMVGDLNLFNVRVVMLVFELFIFSVLMSAMVAAGWSVGESSARTMWPGKLTAADSALFRRWFTSDLGKSIFHGYSWGFGVSGALFVAAYLMIDRWHAIVAVLGTGGVPDAFFGPAAPVFDALTRASFAEVIFRLFFISYIKEKTRRVWLGVLVSTVLWTAAGFSMWPLPFGYFSSVMTLVTLAVLGLVMCTLFLRYDLVTTFTTNFLIVLSGASVPVFTSSGPHALRDIIILVILVAIPLAVALVGLIRRERFVFTPDTMPAHIRRISERERMAKELEIARSVQMSLLPKADPVLEGYDIAGICLPAQEVGGDYYDFVTLGGRNVGIAIGDVSGKGVPAAIYMTLTKGILQSHAEDNVSPKSVLTKVNSLMYRTIERNSFVSMFYAILDTQKRTIRFARAGQCPVILTSHVGSRGDFITPRGIALGLEMGKVFESVLEEREIQLQPSEVLVFYTDGFSEAMNPADEEYGEARLVEAIARYRDRSAREIINGICGEVRSFAGERPQHDDMTMVVLKVGDAAPW
ncbi:MAG TPA: PP2C family protein-serine/threonine phosphatase [Bacteroidota bacterium]|nr:PP2C family protein-serine/threonine phosphatase [Bacteroidota bacterium]